MLRNRRFIAIPLCLEETRCRKPALGVIAGIDRVLEEEGQGGCF